ncbi:MAG: class D beta-lactamase [candidate division NC10 bacterium]|nr:class D beta-lactamase [candidate division NC10 bacterium]
MKTHVLVLLLVLLLSLFVSPCVGAEADLAQAFRAAKVEGIFLLYEPEANVYRGHNLMRADVPFVPASTFKILNSLIALDAGVIRDEAEVIKWDGVQRSIPAWNADQDMRNAMKNSTVWFYQELARRIGRERMQHYVNLAHYGNMDIGGRIDSFWLDGALRITPRQQIDLLVRLQRNALPFSERAQAIVRDILVLETGRDYVLRGKTGWSDSFSPQVGWFVGYLEKAGHPFFFATNIDIVKPEDVSARVAVTRTSLRSLGLLD